jgi:polysaccharide biosynthesis protein PslL
LIVMLSAGYLGIEYFWKFPVPGTPISLPGLPFSLDLALLSSVYFLLGCFLKQEVLEMSFNRLLFISAVVLFFFVHFVFGHTIDLNMRRYDHIFISTVAALAGIYIVISTSILLKGVPIISKVMEYVGSISLFILIFHNYVQMKTIMFLNSLTGNKYIIFILRSFTSFAIALIVSILLHELVKRNAVLKMLFLPIESNKGMQADAMEPRR